MILLPDRSADTGVGGCSRGTNTVDDQKKLSQGECLMLENCIPGDPPQVRNGIVDLFTDIAAIDAGGYGTAYSPETILLSDPNGKEYIFSWVKSVGLNEYVLEVINVTDQTRTALVQCMFENSYVHCSMLKMYECVYCLLDQSILNNLTHPYLKSSFIVYWDISEWSVRSWGIDVYPSITTLIVQDQINAIGNPAIAFSSITNILNNIVMVYGKNAVGKYANSLISTDMIRWTPQTINSYEYLTDENGDLLLDYLDNLNVESFVPRSNHSTIYFNNKLWIMGGETAGGNLLRGCWYSEDKGATWIVQNKVCAWSARKGFAVVNYNERLYLIGGFDGTNPLDDVWTSTDGYTWTQVTVTTPFTTRYGHTAVVFDSKIFIILGHGRTDVWESSDGGVVWTQSVVNAGAGSRKFHASIVFQGKIFVIGGLDGATYKNDVLTSTDGVTWSTLTSSPLWAIRAGHSVVEFQSDLYLYGGFNGSSYLSDCYKSVDGNTWEYSLGGLTKNKYYSTTFTYVRREDSLSKLDSIENYNYEPWSVSGSIIVVGTDEKQLTGTVSLSGTGSNNLTGVGTLFTTELVISDRVRIDGTSKYYSITAIQDDTHATLSNTTSDTYANEKFALLPADGDSITTDDFNPGIDEGIEDLNARVNFYNGSSADFSKILVIFTNNQEAIAKGATHIREYRTLAGDTSAIAAGLDHRYIKDIAITSRNPQQGKYISDDLPDSLLAGESNIVITTGFTTPPLGRFATWDKERVWMSGGGGFWYYSVGASQNVEYPQKFASLFNAYTQKVVCDPNDGQRDTGALSVQYGLFLFKEKKMFVLDNGDPVNIPRVLSMGIGFDFPNTIIFIDHPTLKNAIFGLSTEGPILLSTSGTVEFLSAAKDKNIWPKGLVYDNAVSQIATNNEWKEKVSAVWWQNSIRIIFHAEQYVPTVYGIHLDRGGEYSGSFTEVPALGNGPYFSNWPVVLIPKNTDTCYSLSSMQGTYRVSEYLKKGTYADKFGTEEFHYTLQIIIKPFGLDNNFSIFFEPINANIIASLKDTLRFSIVLEGCKSRYISNTEYAHRINTGLSVDSYNIIRKVLEIIFKGEPYDRLFTLHITKVIPFDGSFVYYGTVLNVEPKQEFEAEFYSESSELIRGWEI